MKRSFPQQTIGATGVAQPAFGTTLTAATFASAAPVALAVTNSDGFYKGDRVKLSAGLAAAEIVEILDVPDATHITVSTTKNHANGDFVQLVAPLSSFYLQSVDGNTAVTYVGDKNVSATRYFSKIIQVAAGQQPTDFYDAQVFGANPGSTEEWWVFGTLNDKFAPSFTYS